MRSRRSKCVLSSEQVADCMNLTEAIDLSLQLICLYTCYSKKLGARVA